MCWADKCCYYVPLNKACILLGITNLAINKIYWQFAGGLGSGDPHAPIQATQMATMVSLSLTIASLACYVAERNMAVITKDGYHHLLLFLGLEWKVPTVNIILSIVAIIGVFWMIFSALLILGVLKNEPSLILCFFSFGIILTIIFMLSGLLMLINQFWWEALIVMIISMINIHFLVVVHSFYDLLQKGNFSFQRQTDSDQDLLADCFDETIDV